MSTVEKKYQLLKLPANTSMLLSSLLLVACGDDDSKTADLADTADTSGAVDTADTGATNDTSDISTEDTGDTDAPLPECDLLTPYRGCTADVSADSNGYFSMKAWDGDGRLDSQDYYLEEAHTTLAYRVVYLYTDGLLTRVEKRDASGNVYGAFTYTYDSAGNLTQFFDGTFQTTYQYNAEGRLVSRLQQTTTMPLHCTWSWTSTASGANYEENCMGYLASGSVDTRGLETFRVFYDMASGEPANETTKVWRSDCQPISETLEYLLGTAVGTSTMYAYDADDRQTEIVEDSGSGTFRTLLTYTCPG